VKKALKNVGTLAGVIVVGIVYFGGIAVLAFGLPIVGAIAGAYVAGQLEGIGDLGSVVLTGVGFVAGIFAGGWILMRWTGE
jgi:hypothetical protein